MLLNKYIQSRIKKFKRILNLFLSSNITLFSTSYLIVTLGFLYKNLIFSLPIIVLVAIKPNRSRLIIGISVLASVMLFLNFRYNYIEQSESLFGKDINIEATVAYPSELNDFDQQVILKLDSVNGLILAKIAKYPLVEVGSKLMLEGKLTRPKNISDSFDYISFLQSKKIFYEFQGKSTITDSANPDIFTSIKNSSENKIKELLGYKESTLLSGILFGSTSTFSEEFKDRLRNSGLFHIVSVSGFNFTFIFIGVLSLAGIFNRRKLQLLAVPLIVFYLLLVGTNNMPAIRATIMILISIFGLIIGRRIANKNIILISILIILSEFPLYWFNISFILSFSALIGLLIFTDSIKKVLLSRYNKLSEAILDTLSSTLAVILSTSAIGIFFFESFSVISLISNIVVLPAIPIIMYLGIVLLILANLNISILNYIILYPLDLILKFVLKSIEFFGQVESKGENIILIGISATLLIIILIILNDYKSFKQKYKYNY